MKPTNNIIFNRGKFGSVHRISDSIGYKCVKKSNDIEGSIHDAIRNKFPDDAADAAVLKHTSVLDTDELNNALRTGFTECKNEEYGFLIRYFSHAQPLIIASAGLNDETKTQIKVKLRTIIGKLHSKGIYHRDIDLTNVMYDASTGSVYLVDFGCAHVDGATVTSLQRTLSYEVFLTQNHNSREK
jgi:serine/threonine protein kinase